MTAKTMLDLPRDRQLALAEKVGLTLEAWREQVKKDLDAADQLLKTESAAKQPTSTSPRQPPRFEEERFFEGADVIKDGSSDRPLEK